ncbi:MAG: peptidoglycan-binding protein [Bryobacteraceae bacterium]|jgi:hypothetical protein
MPQPQNLQKAQLAEIGGQGKSIDVQFNPQTLKLNYSNSYSGGNQPAGSTTQFSGTLATKLSMELWFDVSLPLQSGTPPSDVRKLTEQVAYFMSIQRPTDQTQPNNVPPNVKFQWGSFMFSGTMDSMDETIDLFSPDGVPLRASVSINLSKHDVKFEFAQANGMAPTSSIGTSPLSMAQSGATLQQMAANAGISNWQGVARANGITNPRNLPPGTLVNLSIST